AEPAWNTTTNRLSVPHFAPRFFLRGLTSGLNSGCHPDPSYAITTKKDLPSVLSAVSRYKLSRNSQRVGSCLFQCDVCERVAISRTTCASKVKKNVTRKD